MKAIPRPRVPADAPVQPFKKEEVEALIKACDFCEEADTERRRKYVAQRCTGKRDKAILLTLLDTGLRASELCALRLFPAVRSAAPIPRRKQQSAGGAFLLYSSS